MYNQYNKKYIYILIKRELIIHMKKINNYTKFGLLFNAIFLLGNCTNLLPEFIKGFCVGLALILIFIGIYSENHNISKLRNYKKNILNRILSK